jgi:hypothetical protein
MVSSPDWLVSPLVFDNQRINLMTIAILLELPPDVRGYPEKTVPLRKPLTTHASMFLS